jgi:hypothetical protein
MKDMSLLLMPLSEMKLRTDTKEVGILYSWTSVLDMLTVVYGVLTASVSSAYLYM